MDQTEKSIHDEEPLLVLESYLESGGRVKKDCWPKPMHIRYNPDTEKLEFVDSISSYGGERVLGVRERYERLEDVPYAGYWVKCNEKGDLLE